MKRGGDHGCKEEAGEEAGGKACCEEEGREGQVDEEVVSVARTDVDRGIVVGVGKPSNMTVSLPVGLAADMLFRLNGLEVKKMVLPPGVDPGDVELSGGYSEKDEDMRTVMEVNEDPHDIVHVTVTKKLDLPLESIVLHFDCEKK